MTDYTVGDTIHIGFTTRAFATGIPTVLAGTPVVSAYEDASLTQITAGITLGVDHDSVAGFNMLTIVATGANGYESGKDYHLVITTGTVATVSVVGEVVGRFTLGRSAAFTRLGAPAGASVSADIADIPTVSEFNARTLLAASYFDPATDTVANVTNVATNADMRGTDNALLAASYTAPDNAGITANGAAIDAVATTIGVAGVGLTDLGGMSTGMKAEVNAEVDTGLTDYAAATVTLPGQTAPPNAPTRDEVGSYIYKAWRNKKDNNGDVTNFYADDGTTVDQKQTTSKSGDIVTKAEIVTGP